MARNVAFCKSTAAYQLKKLQLWSVDLTVFKNGLRKGIR